MFVTTFADSAPPRRQEFKLTEIDRTQQFGRMMEQERKRMSGLGRHPRFPSHFTAWS